MSASKNGYLRGLDMRDGKTDSFEDIIAMEGLECTVEVGSKGEGNENGHDKEKGVMFSTTVDIKSDPRRSSAENLV